MTNRIRIASAALVATAAALAIAPQAQAADHRPCVSKVEYQSGNGGNHELTRDYVEARWDVTRSVHMPQLDTRGYYVLAYKACGYSIHEAQVFVAYSLDDDIASDSARRVLPGATLHGKQ